MARKVSDRDVQHPPGWVYFSKSDKYIKRKFTEGYLNTRMTRVNTIGMNQHYVLKVLENPRTQYQNKRVVIDYVLTHPHKFIPLCDETDDEEFNEWARKTNGTASRDFMREFRAKYCRRYRAPLGEGGGRASKKRGAVPPPRFIVRLSRAP